MTSLYILNLDPHPYMELLVKRQIATDGRATTCYFRTSVTQPNRKAIVQITEMCNLHCAHCFISAGEHGDTMPLSDVESLLIPRLLASRVISVTLTGGEPFIHPHLMRIVTLFREQNIGVSICTNATLIDEWHMSRLSDIGGVSCNVSLDGFAPTSHGKFRGNEEAFATTISTIKALAGFGLLKGLLVTPNSLADISEYRDLCEFAIENGATYVLMNPLSRMGRGSASMKKLGAPDEIMRAIRANTEPLSNRVQIVYTRFPNDKQEPLSSCEAGNIIYVFSRGEVTVCPYLVFAANNQYSQHRPSEFIAGNIFHDEDIAARLDDYSLKDRYALSSNPTCDGCRISNQCGKGCPAAIISQGKRIEEVDSDVCPISSQ